MLKPRVAANPPAASEPAETCTEPAAHKRSRSKAPPKEKSVEKKHPVKKRSRSANDPDNVSGEILVTPAGDAGNKTQPYHSRIRKRAGVDDLEVAGLPGQLPAADLTLKDVGQFNQQVEGKVSRKRGRPAKPSTAVGRGTEAGRSDQEVPAFEVEKKQNRRKGRPAKPPSVDGSWSKAGQSDEAPAGEIGGKSNRRKRRPAKQPSVGWTGTDAGQFDQPCPSSSPSTLDYGGPQSAGGGSRKNARRLSRKLFSTAASGSRQEQIEASLFDEGLALPSMFSIPLPNPIHFFSKTF